MYRVISLIVLTVFLTVSKDYTELTTNILCIIMLQLGHVIDLLDKNKKERQ